MSKSLLRTALATALPGTEKAVLVLGGTGQARRLSDLLVADGRLRVVSSLAGRTPRPRLPAGDVRIGGFGGAEGLAQFIRDEDVILAVDATHPFATRISANAAVAAKNAGVARVALVRPPWKPDEGTSWTDCDNLDEARDALPAGARVFLALGSQHLSGFSARNDITFVARMVEAPPKPPFPGCKVITGLPAKSVADEKSVFEREAITHLVCRNSGGDTGLSKIKAANRLGIEILMIRQPPPPAPPHLESPAEVLAFIDTAFSS